MNLFIIPSWYPNPVSPLAGIFTQEQAEAIADIRPDINVIMSTWGHNTSMLPARKPWAWLAKIFWSLKHASTKIELVNGVHEFFTPQLQWTERLPFGGVQQLISVNRKNLLAAKNKFGKIDIIHAHVSFPAGYVASVLAKEFNIPYVVTEHMSPFPFPSLMIGNTPRIEISQAFNQAQAAIAVSLSLAERIASFGYAKPRVIANVVDERRFKIVHATGQKIVFFTLCGISEQKGIDHLIQAIAKWKPDIDAVEFRIGGDGNKLEEYQELARQLGVAPLIKWLGLVNREQAPKLFQECHIYVMPSRHETFGVVYAEAIASGKPIIATRCGGPESIVNEKNGKLIDVGDVEALSETMQTMVSELANYDSKAIRADFEKRFSRPAIVGELVKVYEEVLT